MIRVKICGITNIDDALAAIECGADALGFVFASGSRQVAPRKVREIVTMLPPLVTKVGVFMDHELAEIREIMSFCHLDMAQLHGSEGPEVCIVLFPRVIKVFNIETLPPPEVLRCYKVAAFMVDKEKGKATPPEQIWEVARQMGASGRVILAGGLTPENVAEAIKVARPYAVDVASGVETSPGKKDHRKVETFITRAKAVM